MRHVVFEPNLRILEPEVAGQRLSIQQAIVTLALFDAVALTVFGLFPTFLINETAATTYGNAPDDFEFLPIVFELVVFALVGRLFRIYSTSRVIDFKHSVVRAGSTHFSSFSILIAVAAATKTAQDYSRIWFFSWALGFFIAIIGFRLLTIAHLRRRLRNGDCFFRVISVGLFCPALTDVEIRKYTNEHARSFCELRLASMQDTSLLTELVRIHDIDQIYVRTPWNLAPEAAAKLGFLNELATDLFILPEESDLRAKLIRVGSLGIHPKLQIMERPVRGWDIWLKRALDVSVAGFVLVLLAPLILIVAVAIRLESPGPLIFRQRRAGLNGVVFELWKFRSMYVDQTDHGAAVQSSKHDPRVTRVGRFIRRTSIDELPQFINVLQGRMSVVGPRPHALQTTAEGCQLEEVVEYYAARHRVLPGLTGWAQINGLRGELDSIEKLRRRVDYDMEYIKAKWSPWRDLVIIARTIAKVIYDPGAY
jgi:Undecaprenyl-phosphate glucose phosphotransferase